MSTLMFEKGFKLKKGEGKANIVLFYENVQKAIELNWDALAFADNETDFGYVVIGKHCFQLITDGCIAIKSLETNSVDEFENIDAEKLRELVENKKIYDESKYEILDSNWFSMIHYKECGVNASHEIEYECIDDSEFSEAPKTINELVDLMFKVAYSDVSEEEALEVSDYNDIIVNKTHTLSTGESIMMGIYVDRKEFEKAKHSNWEAWAFADNETLIASIVAKDKCLKLTTSGLVEIKNENDEVVYNNSDFKELSIMALTQDLSIFEEMNMTSNNWFSLLIYDKVVIDGVESYRTYDDTPYDDCPKDVDYLIESLINTMESILTY